MENDPSLPTDESTTQKTPYQQLESYAYTLIDQVQSPLAKLQQELFDQVQYMRSQKFGVPRFKLEETEVDYWRVTEKVQSLEERINLITTTLDAFESHETSEDELKALLPHEETEPEKISKKKQAIAREEERLKKIGIDPREIAFERHVTGFGSDSYRFTTGKHQKKISGSMSTYSAESIFFDRTTDTHGGKVSSGKRSGYYVTAGGKKIRKS